MKQAYGYKSLSFIAGFLTLLASMSTLAQGQEYRINPGDVLQVFVWNEETLSGDVLVQPDGYIRFPMVGQLKAGGKTVSDVERAVIESFKQFLKDEPAVTASIKSIHGNKIYVIGNVSRPGEYVVNRNIDIMQALALAGGLNAYAAENDIRVLRRKADGQSVAVKFPYASIKRGKQLQSNLVLQGGDTVVVP